MTTTTPGFRPTHVVPRDGMAAWDAPDPVRPTVPLDALLPVRLVERRGDWGHVLCANGWSAWVDGRLLVAVPQDPPAAGQPPARTADPRPLLARAEETLRRYRRHVEELAAGRLDLQAFHDLTKGIRAGIVLEGEAVWLYEAEHERWVYCDGTHATTYATREPPSATTDGPDPPTADLPPDPPTGPTPAPADTTPPPDPAASGGEPPAAGGHAPTQVVRGPGPSGAASPSGPAAPGSAPPAAAGHAPTQVVPGVGPEPSPAARNAEPEPAGDVRHAVPESAQAVPGGEPGPAPGAADVGPEAPGGREGIRHAPTRFVAGDGGSAGHGDR
ncbi:hypothetical protein [Streptomyces dioscori]|uniref:hypothetical protein n=1 Tax=Streptomyces dioscori TaxID=2109333 RepID=UPI0026CA2225|nr:hypothetical protein [Streptomyces dioscori]